MSIKFSLLDCTLRDGAYINGSIFGDSVISGLIEKIQNSGIEYVECGWLKDNLRKQGSTYFMVPRDAKEFLKHKRIGTTYVAMIDFNRYETDKLEKNDGKSFDAVRVVFPRGKVKEGISKAQEIREKGYRVFIQAANTLGYSDDELEELISEVNRFKPEALSIVDTFGAMYSEDLLHIVKKLDNGLYPEIKLGFHSHNNQQLSFALSICFINSLIKSKRKEAIIDSSLGGMGRGAGNTTTELIASYFDRKNLGNYDLNCIMDALDMYIDPLKKKFEWGYSTSFFIAGLYQCHVNNIAYLREQHRTTAHDMRSIISSLDSEERRHYDYDLLEKRYFENQSREFDDADNLSKLNNQLKEKNILILAPGTSIQKFSDKILNFIKTSDPVVIGVNALSNLYKYDYLFFSNKNRYDYALNYNSNIFNSSLRLVLSNMKELAGQKDLVFNYNNVVKRGWVHFDNAVLLLLRLLSKLEVSKIFIAGFDGFTGNLANDYLDRKLPPVLGVKSYSDLNSEILDMFRDFRKSVYPRIRIEFLTNSYFDEKKDEN